MGIDELMLHRTSWSLLWFPSWWINSLFIFVVPTVGNISVIEEMNEKYDTKDLHNLVSTIFYGMEMLHTEKKENLKFMSVIVIIVTLLWILLIILWCLCQIYNIKQ